MNTVTVLPEKFGFYGILTEPVVGYIQLARIFIEQKVPFIQLRMKRSSPDKIRDIAKELARLTRGTQSRFILNDDPVLAKQVGADGVHLGQSDMPYHQARALLGDKAIIGLSTHNVEQVVEANHLRPDYIGMGPVYSTPTKETPDPVIGLQGLRNMRAYNRLPFIAIGGIDLTNIADVKAAGAFNIAAVRLVNQALDPAKVLDQIRRY